MADAGLAPYPKFKGYVKDTNTPLAGGLLYTYDSITSNPKATQVSRTGADNTNPVVLDANGEADVWYTEGEYKLVLKDSDDVTQWTVNGVSSAGDLPGKWVEDGSGNIYRATGDVYIGATTGGEKLTVAGTFSASGAVTLSDTVSIGGDISLSKADPVLTINDSDALLGAATNKIEFQATGVEIGSIEYLSGNLEITNAGAGGEVNLLTASGDIRLEVGNGAFLDLGHTSLDVELSTGGGTGIGISSSTGATTITTGGDNLLSIGVGTLEYGTPNAKLILNDSNALAAAATNTISFEATGTEIASIYMSSQEMIINNAQGDLTIDTFSGSTLSLGGAVSDVSLINAQNAGLYVDGATSLIEIKNTTSGKGISLTSDGLLTLEASTTSDEPLVIPHGQVPSAPANGAMWTTVAGLYVQINGSTIGPLS